MALPIFPANVDDFDLELELDTIKTRIPAESGGLWTDTSETDPGVTLIRLVLERIYRWLYTSSSRFVPDDMILLLGKLMGVPTTGATRSSGQVSLTVGPNTTIQPGFRIADEAKGIEYVTLNSSPVISVTGGTIVLEAICSVAGTIGDTLEPDVITGVRGTPSTGTVTAVTNITAFGGGSENETLEQWRARLPFELFNDTIQRKEQYETTAIRFGMVRARVFRATRPFGPVGSFIRQAGHVTLICMGANGASPGQTALDELAALIKSKSYYQDEPDIFGEEGLHVIGVRNRTVGFTASVSVKAAGSLATVKAAGEAKVKAFLNPVTGGQRGTGYGIGRGLRTSDLVYGLETLQDIGLESVDLSSIVITNAANLALDEVISPDLTPTGVIITAAFDQDGGS